MSAAKSLQRTVRTPSGLNEIVNALGCVCETLVGMEALSRTSGIGEHKHTALAAVEVVDFGFTHPWSAAHKLNFDFAIGIAHRLTAAGTACNLGYILNAKFLKQKFKRIVVELHHPQTVEKFVLRFKRNGVLNWFSFVIGKYHPFRIAVGVGGLNIFRGRERMFNKSDENVTRRKVEFLGVHLFASRLLRPDSLFLCRFIRVYELKHHRIARFKLFLRISEDRRHLHSRKHLIEEPLLTAPKGRHGRRHRLTVACSARGDESLFHILHHKLPCVSKLIVFARLGFRQLMLYLAVHDSFVGKRTRRIHAHRLHVSRNDFHYRKAA